MRINTVQSPNFGSLIYPTKSKQFYNAMKKNPELSAQFKQAKKVFDHNNTNDFHVKITNDLKLELVSSEKVKWNKSVDLFGDDKNWEDIYYMYDVWNTLACKVKKLNKGALMEDGYVHYEVYFPTKSGDKSCLEKNNNINMIGKYSELALYFESMIRK